MQILNSIYFLSKFNDPLATNWSGFEIYVTVLLTLAFIGFAIYQSFGFEKKKVIGNAIAALICVGISFFISIRVLNNLSALLIALGWLFLILIGLASILFLIYGIFVTDPDTFQVGSPKKIFTIASGVFGFVLCIIIGRQVLHFPFLLHISLKSPYLYGAVASILFSVLFGFLINLFKTSISKSGNAVNRSAEWRIVGSNTKYRDATTRDVYDHQYGRGSWTRNNNSTITTLRWISCGVAIFLPFWLFNNDIHIFTTFKFLASVNFEYSRMLLNQRIGLYIFLFIISGIISLYFNSISEKYI